MKDELNREIIKKFSVLRRNIYPYVRDNDKDEKKAQDTKNML